MKVRQRVSRPRRRGNVANANAVRERRFAIRATMKEVADRAGLSLTAVSLLERGLRVDPVGLAALAAAVEAIADESAGR